MVNDGATGADSCAIAPGQTFKYVFKIYEQQGKLQILTSLLLTVIDLCDCPIRHLLLARSRGYLLF